MAISEKQKSVVFGALGGLVGTIAIVLLAWLGSMPPFEVSSTEDRLSLLTACLASPAICLIVTIGRMARLRFRSTTDIDSAAGGEPSPKARILSAIVQNTAEQCLLAALVYTIASLQLPASLTDTIGYAAVSFLIGRVLFAWGYEG